jgi:hypothetical protein
MDHMRYKANLTAASYVARGLDESTQEDFELHLMSCPECVDDVEAWRALEKHMPSAERTAVAPIAPARASLNRWRLAASLVAIGMIGAASGWYWRGFADPDLDKTEFFNTLPLTRGAYCTPLKYAADTQRVVLRIAGVASDRKVVALTPQGEALAARSYSARRQTDGSWLLQFAAASLTPRAIRLESQGATGPGESLGCISAQIAP